jgi:hypothetical protein
MRLHHLPVWHLEAIWVLTMTKPTHITMTTAEFREKVKTREGRREVIEQILRKAVEEWMNDGPIEVARVLTVWATRPDDDPATPRLSFGADEDLLEHAEWYDVVRDPDTAGREGPCDS